MQPSGLKSEQQKPISMVQEFAHLSSASLGVCFFFFCDVFPYSHTTRDRARARVVVGCCHISIVNNAFEIGKFIPLPRSTRRHASKGNIFDCFLSLSISFMDLLHTKHLSHKEIAGQWLMPCEQDEYPSVQHVRLTVSLLTYDVFERSMLTFAALAPHAKRNEAKERSANTLCLRLQYLFTVGRAIKRLLCVRYYFERKIFQSIGLDISMVIEYKRVWRKKMLGKAQPFQNDIVYLLEKFFVASKTEKFDNQIEFSEWLSVI